MKRLFMAMALCLVCAMSFGKAKYFDSTYNCRDYLLINTDGSGNIVYSIGISSSNEYEDKIGAFYLGNKDKAIEVLTTIINMEEDTKLKEDLRGDVQQILKWDKKKYKLLHVNDLKYAAGDYWINKKILNEMLEFLQQ